MRIYCTIIVGLALLTGCSGSGTDSANDDDTVPGAEADPTSPAQNIYANGFRLARLTHTLSVGSNARATITDYDYDFSINQVLITRSVAGEDDEPRISRLEIDDAGRLIGGSYDYSFGTAVSGTADYTLRYDEQGKVSEFSESQFDKFTFNYNGDLLDNIVHRLSGTTYTYRFTYDAQGQRLTSLDGVVLVTTQFEYNTAGQLSSATEINQFGEELFSYEFGYDMNGNHVSTLSYTPFGELFSTDLYTYEASANTIFNHGIMRQVIEPFEATNTSFVR